MSAQVRACSTRSWTSNGEARHRAPRRLRPARQGSRRGAALRGWPRRAADRDCLRARRARRRRARRQRDIRGEGAPRLRPLDRARGLARRRARLGGDGPPGVRSARRGLLARTSDPGAAEARERPRCGDVGASDGGGARARVGGHARCAHSLRRAYRGAEREPLRPRLTDERVARARPARRAHRRRARRGRLRRGRGVHDRRSRRGIRVLRVGGTTVEALERVVGPLELALQTADGPEGTGAPEAPGQLSRHYAPSAARGASSTRLARAQTLACSLPRARRPRAARATGRCGRSPPRGISRRPPASSSRRCGASIGLPCRRWMCFCAPSMASAARSTTACAARRSLPPESAQADRALPPIVFPG